MLLSLVIMLPLLVLMAITAAYFLRKKTETVVDRRRANNRATNNTEIVDFDAVFAAIPAIEMVRKRTELA